MAAAADRHGKQGGKRFLPSFRAVDKGGMHLRIGQVERMPRGGRKPDQSLAHAQAGAADRVGAQALGGKQFEDVAGPQHVDRADFRHQLGGNQAGDLA